MLIIFDLDDTLIDTSGCIIPIQLEHALKKMVAEGLSVPNEQEALDVLKRLDRTAESSRASLSEFLEILDLKEKYYSIGLEQIYENFPQEATVFPLDDVLEGLKELKEKHCLCMVTAGKKDLQLEKMKKAGIDSTIFSKIAVCEGKDKRLHYEAILEELGFAPHQVVVCGDRIEIDLMPAKEMGCLTIHMKWGRGLYSKPPLGLSGMSRKNIDFVVTEFKQVGELIGKIGYLPKN